MPRTKTCHECVWLSGVPGGRGLESEKGSAVLPMTNGRRICVNLTRFPNWFDGAILLALHFAAFKRGCQCNQALRVDGGEKK